MLCCWPEEYVTKCCWLNLKNSVSAFLWFIHCFILGVHSHFWGVQPHDCWTWHQKWKFGEGLVSNRYSEDYKIIPSKSPMPLQVGKKQTSEFIASRWGPKTRRMFASAEVSGIHQQRQTSDDVRCFLECTNCGSKNFLTFKRFPIE